MHQSQIIVAIGKAIYKTAQSGSVRFGARVESIAMTASRLCAAADQRIYLFIDPPLIRIVVTQQSC